jgi:hypothetical protein
MMDSAAWGTAPVDEDKRPEEDAEFLNMLRKQGIAIENLKPGELDALYEDYAGKRDLVATQRAQAQSLVNTALPEGRQAGGIYAASNPSRLLALWLTSMSGRGARGRPIKRVRRSMKRWLWGRKPTLGSWPALWAAHKPPRLLLRCSQPHRPQQQAQHPRNSQHRLSLRRQIKLWLTKWSVVRPVRP